MKKVLALIAVLTIVIGMMAMNVSAEIETEGVIKKGTPVVDGIIDDLYLESYSIVTDTSDPEILVEKVYADKDLTSTLYFLHDVDYLYMVAEVSGDTNVVDTGMTDWVADSVEVWISSYDTGDPLYSKVPMGAYGNALPNGAIGQFDNKLHIDYSLSEIAAVQNDNGYVVELKIPLIPYDYYEPCLAVNVQVNNVDSADMRAATYMGKAIGIYGEQYIPSVDNGHKLALEDYPAREPLPTETEPQETFPTSQPTTATTAPAATQPADTNATEPANNNLVWIIVAAAAVVIVAVVAVVLSKKKK